VLDGGRRLPLGLAEGKGNATESHVALEPGDILLLYTDGITEAANARGEEFGLDRLQAAVKPHTGEPLVAIAVAIETAVEVFADGTPFGDDRTVVMLRREA
jgi:serine phosphatase RsbU (regulator of sigma subunit)